MYQTLRYEKQENIGILTINRPEALNALNSTVIGDLEQAITEVEKDAELGALIITGEGRSFVAGADIGEQLPLDVAGGRKWGQRGSALMRRIEKLEIPTIAAVNGFALGGGCELAMSCDIILAAGPNAEGKGGAKFGQPEVGLGITPGFGGTQRLARLVGMGMAKQLVYSALNIKADEAYRIGLVNAVYPQAELMENVLKLAGKIAKNAPIAVRNCKKAINDGISLPIEKAVEVEEKLFGDCFETHDQKEGMACFLSREKPKPKAVFTNN